ncbi:MAG TPA: TraR/DksA C4-type zinc finger protein [Thermoanaerobaculia bacterium]|nr:TraR/DksA C4-type zinc finger protein [Thermoanaerobaculia bacterium]
MTTRIDHLSEEQLEELRLRLEAAREQIDLLLDQTRADSVAPDLDLPIGRLSRIDAIQMQAMAQMNRRQLEVRRQQVLAALAAHESGAYGLCRSCRGPIAPARLEVLPEVPFCVGCQDRFERER